MARTLAPVRIGCPARVHSILQYGRFLRWRCTDRNCPEVRDAKSRRVKVFHVYDLETGKQWTDTEPKQGKE